MWKLATFLLLHFTNARITNLEINTNVEVDNVEFRARVETAGKIEFGALKGCWFFSADAEYEDNKNDDGTVQDANAEFEVVAGAVYTTNQIPLSLTLADFRVTADYEGPTDDTAAELDVEGSRGFVANVYASLDEIDENGDSVQRIDLVNHWLSQLFGEMKWELSNVEISNDGETEVKSCTFTGSNGLGVPGEDDFSIDATFIKSGVIGTVDGALVTPNSVESFIYINNFPYEEENTFVRLTMFVGMASAEKSVGWSASQQLDDGGSAYFTLDHTAEVDGEVTDVSVSGFAEVELDGTFQNDQIQIQLNAAYGAEASAYKVEIDFPIGADHIRYDPGSGVGKAPKGGAYRITNLATFTLLAALVAMWVM